MASKAQDAYVKLYVDEIEKNYYPAYVPWHVQSLNKLFLRFEKQEYSDAIFKLTDKLLELQNTNTSSQFVPDTVGRFYNSTTPEYGAPHSSSDGVYLEGVAHAYEVAVKVNDAVRKGWYWDSIILGLHNLQNLQFSNYDRLYFAPKPDEVLGAMRVSVTVPDVRIDTTAHCLDAMEKISQLMNEGLFSLHNAPEVCPDGASCLTTHEF